jgi:hypothetical protein
MIRNDGLSKPLPPRTRMYFNKYGCDIRMTEKEEDQYLLKTLGVQKYIEFLRTHLPYEK